MSEYWLISNRQLKQPGNTLAETNTKPVCWLDTWGYDGKRPHWVPTPYFAYWFTEEAEADTAIAWLAGIGITGYKLGVSWADE